MNTIFELLLASIFSVAFYVVYETIRSWLKKRQHRSRSFLI